MYERDHAEFKKKMKKEKGLMRIVLKSACVSHVVSLHAMGLVTIFALLATTSSMLLPLGFSHFH